jgi:steroid delta-isomerase-like uncharacterized protein
LAAEESRALVERVVEAVWNRGELAVVDALFAPDYREHNPRPGQPAGVEGYKRGVAALRAAFPDLHLALEDLVAAGDKVAFRYTMRGTHRGELMGLPPTGKSFAIGGMVFARIAGGKVVERAGNQDELGLLQQLGALPA